jgi:hypothetical protein
VNSGSNCWYVNATSRNESLTACTSSRTRLTLAISGNTLSGTDRHCLTGLYTRYRLKNSWHMWLQPSDFQHDPEQRTCLCPAGKSLYGHGSHCLTRGLVNIRFQGAQRDCLPCTHRARCLRTPAITKTRQVAFFQGPLPGAPQSHSQRMKRRIDSPVGRALYGRRFATVEPVFANLRYNKGLERFTLRGRSKVNAQWQ